MAARTGSTDRVLQLITEAAAAGRVCPTNGELSDALGMGGEGAASRVVSQLEARGLIAVERFPRARIVTIVATGQRTATPAGATRAVGREDELADHLADGLTLHQAARAMGIGHSTAFGLWGNIKRGMGWQAQ